MIDAVTTLINIGTDILRAALVLISLFTILKVGFKTSFALVPMAGALLVVYLVNWGIGNIDWAKNLFNKDAQKLSLTSTDTTTGARQELTANTVVRLAPPGRPRPDPTTQMTAGPGDSAGAA